MDVSIVVPLFNEESRMDKFLASLKEHSKNRWEVILVNDGSTDKTLEKLQRLKIPNKKIISYKKNMGKGFAVKKGVNAAKGDYVIFIDADGSIHPSQIKDMLRELKKYDVVIGSRASNHSKVMQQPFFREFIGIIFNKYTNLLFNVDTDDSLCGFKGFRRDAAKSLFGNLISRRWVFDVELLYKIKKNGYSLYKMPIVWVYKSNSKMELFDPVKIAINLLYLRLRLIKW